MDKAHEETEHEIRRVEAKLRKLYRGAYEELDAEIRSHVEKLEPQRRAMLQLVEDGSMPRTDFDSWWQSEVMNAVWYADMMDSITDTLVNASEVAAGIVNESAPAVYALNMNRATYEIERAARVSTAFALYDAETVRRLLKENRMLLPEVMIQRGKQRRWDSQHVSSAILQGIIKGETGPEVAARLQHVCKMDANSAIRNARTAMTSAQNAGRRDSYLRAEERGIKLKKEWMSTLDGRTRHSHRRLDGERVGVDEEFSNGCRFPGDPRGKPAEVYNCRCTMRAVVEGVEYDKGAVRASKLGNMSYEEWRRGL